MGRTGSGDGQQGAAVGVRPARGRPRADGAASAGSPRDQVIAAATRLFAEQGYAETTMSDIARAAGLRQSSLYYWFNRKELILQAAFGVNRAPLDFVIRIGTEPGSPALKLFRLVRFDVRQLCEAPCDVNEVERLAGLNPELFEEFWRDRQALHDWVVQLVVHGIEAGEMVDLDPQLTALNLLSAHEGLPNWFRSQGDHAPGSGAAFTHPGYDAAAVAEHAAVLAVRSLLRRPGDVRRIAQRAAELDLDPS